METVKYLDTAQLIDGRSQTAFDRLIAPLHDQNVTVIGYWARDRSHPYYNETGDIGLLESGDNGKMEVHPVVALIVPGTPTGTDNQVAQEFRVFAFSDASDDDRQRAALEVLEDSPISRGTHVPHRGESHDVSLHVPVQPSYNIKLEVLEEINIAQALSVTSAPDLVGGITYNVSTGSGASNTGFYYVNGRFTYSVSPPQQSQDDWGWCEKCNGLFWAGGQATAGTCPGGGNHERRRSSDYSLVMDTPAAQGQHDWRWCNRCSGLFWAGGQDAAGTCPAGGSHVRTTSSDYCLVMDVATPPGQPGWRWCGKCSGLFWAGGQPTGGTCPTGGSHAMGGNTDYSVVIQ